MADTERLDDLKAKLKARQGKPGYAINCEALRQEIAKLSKSE